MEDALATARGTDSIEPFNANVLVTDDARRVVRLQRERALVENAREGDARFMVWWLFPIYRDLVVDLDGDVFVFDDDVIGVPLVVFDQLLPDVHYIVEAAGLLPIGVRLVNLHLEAVLRPPFGLVLRVEVDAAVRSRLGHHFNLEFEVDEGLFVADVIQMVAGAVRDERALLERPRVRIFFRLLPAVERLAVEDGFETFFVLGLPQAGRGQGEQNSDAQQKRSDLHLEYLLEGTVPRA